MDVYVVGAYGYRNFGDDAYVDVLRAHLRSVWLEADLQFHGLKKKALTPEETQAVLLGGGGLLCDYVAGCDTDNLKYFLRYPAAGQLFGKRTYGLSLGVQGHLAADRLSPHLPVLNAMDVLAVRDADSAETLRGNGVTSAVLECADLSYLVKVAPWIPGGSQNRRPVLGIVASQPDRGVVYGEFSGFESRVAEAMESLEKDFEIRLFSFSDAGERWLLEAFGERFAPAAYNPGTPDAVGRFAQNVTSVDVLLTSRFHGITLSITRGIPFVALGAPREKNERECAAIDHPYFLSYDQPAGRIVAAVKDAWSERESVQERLTRARPERSRLAVRNLETIQRVEVDSKQSNRQADLDAGPANRAGSRTLVIWAAQDRHWEECRPVRNRLGAYDVLVPGRSRITDSRIERRLALNPGTFMHWAVLPPDMKTAVGAAYRQVIVCHDASNKLPAHLKEITDAAAAPGGQTWELGVWRNALGPIPSRSSSWN